MKVDSASRVMDCIRTYPGLTVKQLGRALRMPSEVVQQICEAQVKDTMLTATWSPDEQAWVYSLQ